MKNNNTIKRSPDTNPPKVAKVKLTATNTGETPPYFVQSVKLILQDPFSREAYDYSLTLQFPDTSFIYPVTGIPEFGDGDLHIFFEEAQTTFIPIELFDKVDLVFSTGENIWNENGVRFDPIFETHVPGRPIPTAI